MQSVLAKLLLSPESTKILIEGPEGDLLKARFSLPNHPRALLTLLEGAALWTGTPLVAAISAEGRLARERAEVLFGAEWPLDSALVHFVAAVQRPKARRARIHGVGDFRQLSLLVPEVRS